MLVFCSYWSLWLFSIVFVTHSHHTAPSIYLKKRRKHIASEGGIKRRSAVAFTSVFSSASIWKGEYDSVVLLLLCAQCERVRESALYACVRQTSNKPHKSIRIPITLPNHLINREYRHTFYTASSNVCCQFLHTPHHTTPHHAHHTRNK